LIFHVGAGVGRFGKFPLVGTTYKQITASPANASVQRYFNHITPIGGTLQSDKSRAAAGRARAHVVGQQESKDSSVDNLFDI